MIQYYKGALGINLLFRFHGSGLYRAMIPGLLSTCLYLLINLQFRKNQAVTQTNTKEEMEDDLSHPYAVGVLVSSVSFLIVFRANFAYQRYWDACGSVFHLMSKWLDATTHTASYHMQSAHYKHIRPPSFFDYPELDTLFLTRDRERGVYNSTQSPSGTIGSSDCSDSLHQKRTTPRRHKSINYVSDRVNNSGSTAALTDDSWEVETLLSPGEPRPLRGTPRLDGGWQGLFNDETATFYEPNSNQSIRATTRDEIHNNSITGFDSTSGGRTPPLFLQELAHLSSLLMAVALSTLRNDIEGAPSPLSIYKPGSSFPPVDPTSLSKDWINLKDIFHALFGFDTCPETRTKYNASHPLPVIGGVSDAEIRFIQMAKGPSAKTQLCWQWLSEFIIREHLAGSTGNVGPPIISRNIQFLSDGMIHYNHARKTMFIPFPFPHAQLSVFYIIAVIPSVPFLMDQYTNETWIGAMLSFLTVTCLSGLHEVARQLENPFKNVPNEIPLTTMQSMYNESLITMYAGFHPDHFWDPQQYQREHTSKRPNGKSEGDHTENTKAKANVNNSPMKVEQKKSASHGTSHSGTGKDIDEFKQILKEQSKEIERLRTLVERGERGNKHATLPNDATRTFPFS